MLRFVRDSTSISTDISLPIERYMGEGSQAHLISVIGGDTNIAAIAAAINEQSQFNIQFPDGQEKNVTLGETAVSFRGGLSVPGHKRPIRHLVGVSRDLLSNGSLGAVYMINYNPALAWSFLASSMGIPALPGWGSWVLKNLEAGKRLSKIDGFGCSPHKITVTRDEIMEIISRGLKRKVLHFPAKNGPILWPAFKIADALHFDGLGDLPGVDPGLAEKSDDDEDQLDASYSAAAA